MKNSKGPSLFEKLMIWIVVTSILTIITTTWYGVIYVWTNYVIT